MVNEVSIGVQVVPIPIHGSTIGEECEDSTTSIEPSGRRRAASPRHLAERD